MYSITENLQNQLNKAKSLNELQQLQQKEAPSFATPAALEYLLTTIKAHGMDRAALIKLMQQQSLLERTHIYHLLSGKLGLTRDKLIQFALVGRLNLQEVNTLLKYARFAQLYARDSRDAVLIYAFQQQLSLRDTNQALAELEHRLLS